MLQIIFGDDEHTASDGPYARVLKTRKWLYLSSAAGIAVATGLYNENAATDLLKVFSLPTKVVSQALTFGVGYLIAQYILLNLQLFTTYDIVLAERFAFRRADDLAAARSALTEASNQHSLAIENYLKDKSAAFEVIKSDNRDAVNAAEVHLTKALEHAEASGRKGASGQELKEALYLASRGKAMLAERKAELTRLEDPATLESFVRPNHDPNVETANEKVHEARQALMELQRQVPSMRKGYRLSETFIDLLRIIPPVLFACLAFILLVR